MSREKMELWKTRHHSMEKLANDFKEQNKCIENVFEIIDDSIDLFNKSSNDNYHKICGLVLAKGRNYALGTYSLILDGLGQEAGALMRPLIEYHELLTYFRLEPNRVEEAIEDKLPSAGNRAKLIEGYFHEFRKHLNEHSSHSSFSEHSLNHILDKVDMVIKKEQLMLPKVLFKNMGDLFVQIILMAIEALNCLQTVNVGSVEKQANIIEKIKQEGIVLFNMDKRPEIVLPNP